MFARALAAKNLHLLDQERLLTLNRVSSVGLLAIGVVAIAEACGVAVQSILTVGGIGGEYFNLSMLFNSFSLIF